MDFAVRDASKRCGVMGFSDRVRIWEENHLLFDHVLEQFGFQACLFPGAVASENVSGANLYSRILPNDAIADSLSRLGKIAVFPHCTAVQIWPMQVRSFSLWFC